MSKRDIASLHGQIYENVKNTFWFKKLCEEYENE
jgi:hypothetical protein